MTLAEYRNSPNWKMAVALGPDLMRIAEELPAAESMGLSFQLRQLMVDVPASIASDALYGTNTGRAATIRLATALELVDTVYPALDLSNLRRDVDQLADALAGELGAAPAVAPTAQAPAPIEEAEPAPAAAPAAPTHVMVQAAAPSQESEQSDVHADSVQ